MIHENPILAIMKPASIIAENATLRETLKKMNTDRTNTLLVIDAEGMLTGEISVTDLLGAVVPEDLDGDGVFKRFADEELFAEAIKNAADKSIEDFIVRDIESVRPDARLIDVAATAITMGQARIPVVDHDDHPIGIISRQELRQILTDYLKG